MVRRRIERAWTMSTALQQVDRGAVGAARDALARDDRRRLANAVDRGAGLLDSGRARVRRADGRRLGGQPVAEAGGAAELPAATTARSMPGARGAPAFDKVPLKFAGWDAAPLPGRRLPRGARAPWCGASAYIAPGVVLMPSFVNVGAYVDRGTMIDTWATVGSCAQVGRNCHISGGVGLGGVLEPLQANPVIIEDDCFIGARSEVVEGVIVERGSVLSMGVLPLGDHQDRRPRDRRGVRRPRAGLFGRGARHAARQAAARRLAGPGPRLRRDRQARRRAHAREDLAQRTAARLIDRRSAAAGAGADPLPERHARRCRRAGRAGGGADRGSASPCTRLRFGAIENLFARHRRRRRRISASPATPTWCRPATAAWSAEPFAGEVRDGVLYGRGACDMKGAIAAFVAAAAAASVARHGRAARSAC